MATRPSHESGLCSELGKALFNRLSHVLLSRARTCKFSARLRPAPCTLSSDTTALNAPPQNTQVTRKQLHGANKSAKEFISQPSPENTHG
eukprot:392979-Prymnesium_polylepis.1